MTASRRRLPNRRASFTFNFESGPHCYTATVSYFPGTDQLAEIFLGNGRAGSDVDAAAKDSAVVSLALQWVVPVSRSTARAAPYCAHAVLHHRRLARRSIFWRKPKAGRHDSIIARKQPADPRPRGQIARDPRQRTR